MIAYELVKINNKKKQIKDFRYNYSYILFFLYIVKYQIFDDANQQFSVDISMNTEPIEIKRTLCFKGIIFINSYNFYTNSFSRSMVFR